MRQIWGCLALLGLICTPACLAESASQPARDIPDTFLGADTIGVIRIDVERIDAPGLRDWSLKALRDGHMDPQAVEDFAEQVRGMVTKTENWRGDFERAGAAKLYIVVRQPIIAKLPFVVVPLGKASDP